MADIQNVIVTERKCVLGGVEYSIKPPTLSDWSYFINWSRDQKKKDLIETYKLAGEKIDIKAISEVMVGLEDAISGALQVKGLIVLAHRLITKNKNNPAITVEQLEDNLDMKDINVLSDIIMSSMPGAEDEKNLIKPQTESKSTGV